MTSISKRTEITLLGPQVAGIRCEARGCEQPAAFLFRTGEGPIDAFCELHASETGAKLGVSVPELPRRVLSAGWSI
jgi:hypothetical protein